MTDREMLELAAKAAGIAVINVSHVRSYLEGCGLHVGFDDDGGATRWNPLADDGDALRLAVEVHIDFKCYDTVVRTWVGDPVAQRVIASVEEACGSDHYAAARRAIVRAAAEIGKQQVS